MSNERKVVITTVALRPTLSPIQPNIKAPKGLKTKMEQKEKADNKDAVKGSVFGKNNSLSNTAI